MKRFTFILSLLLAFVGITASAQTYTVKKFATQGTRITSVDEITDGGLYAFRATNLNKYIKLSIRTDYKLNNDGTLSADDASDGLAVFKIHVNAASDGAKTYSFESAFGGIYMQPVGNGPVYGGTEAATFEICTTDANGNEQEAGVFYIKNAVVNDGETYVYFDMQGSQFVGWDGKGNNGKYEIIPVTVSDDELTYRPITHRVVDEGGNNVTGYLAPFEAGFYADGTVLSGIPATSYYCTCTLNGGNNVTGESNTEFVYNVAKTGEAPVTFSTADNKTWYKIQIKDGGRTLKSIAEDNTLHICTKTSSFNATDLGDFAGFNSAVWCFVESGLGVKLYNKGTGKYVKWVSSFAELVNEANASTYYIVENENDANGFGLWTGASTGNRYLNAARGKDKPNDRLGAWNANGGGSCFIVEAIDANADLVTVGKELFASITVTPNETNETYVTAKLQADIDNAFAASQSASTVADLDAAFASFDIPTADINPNAVYRIRNVNSSTKKYASTNEMCVGTDGTLANAYNQNNNMDRTVRRTTADDDFMSQLWYLEANDNGTYKIKSANVGAYWCNSAANNIDMPISKNYSGDFTFQAMPNVSFNGNDGKTMFLLSIGGRHVNAYQGDNNNVIKNWQQLDDAGNYWQIEKVTSIPVAIGETGYASIGYPFAVQVPAGSDVKAYYASAAGNGCMTLTEIEDGLIPANTGAILVNESNEGGAANVTLTINTTTDKTISDNKLVAATAKRIGFTAGENYLLAKDTDNEVKFLQAEITTVPANKAYLPAANVEGVVSFALAFDFNNQTTGINGVEQETKDVKYFDLNGRRVFYPANGIFVTSTGKKVIIK